MGPGEHGVGLARFVPRIALEWAVEEPEARWRPVPATMVFADISGFTALTERLSDQGRVGAEELVEVLRSRSSVGCSVRCCASPSAAAARC